MAGTTRVNWKGEEEKTGRGGRRQGGGAARWYVQRRTHASNPPRSLSGFGAYLGTCLQPGGLGLFPPSQHALAWTAMGSIALTQQSAVAEAALLSCIRDTLPDMHTPTVAQKKYVHPPPPTHHTHTFWVWQCDEQWVGCRKILAQS